MKNIVFALLGFILLTAPLAATAQQSGDFTYTSDGSAITITGYTGPGGAVTIPNSIAGLTVVSIGDNAFYTSTSLTSVTVPDSVTNIGNNAFAYCYSLTSATLGIGVTGIGYNAFYHCFSLTNAAIPDSITSIRDWAFSHSGLASVTIPANVTHLGIAPFAACSRMTAITVDAANASYSSLDGVLLNKGQTALIEYPGGKTGSYTTPNSVTSIADAAFDFCTNLTSVTIPDGVGSIGEGVFANCYSLTSVTIGNGVTNIFGSPIPGAGAFYDCYNLQTLFFKGNAPAVSVYAFYAYSYVTVYYLPGTTGWGLTFANHPTRLWNPLMQTRGVGPGGFGFNITGTADIPIVVEAATSLASSTWIPLQSLNLTNGAFHFSDPNWTNYPARFYRIRSP